MKAYELADNIRTLFKSEFKRSEYGFSAKVCLSRLDETGKKKIECYFVTVNGVFISRCKFLAKIKGWYTLRKMNVYAFNLEVWRLTERESCDIIPLE